MIAFLTARASVVLFGKESEKEDIVLVDFEQKGSSVSFSLKSTESVIGLLRTSSVFALNIINATEKQKDCSELEEGLFVDKFKVCGFKEEECNSIDCPCIEDAEVLECSIITLKEEGNLVFCTGKILNHQGAKK
ncbi:MAG TPA: flavin reductase family protein [Candidatus Nanoarchaeia archaeon]|nr:flavin reductase family protein [Candidatus Nanoarchaeia archaeon]